MFGHFTNFSLNSLSPLSNFRHPSQFTLLALRRPWPPSNWATVPFWCSMLWRRRCTRCFLRARRSICDNNAYWVLWVLMRQTTQLPSELSQLTSERASPMPTRFTEEWGWRWGWIDYCWMSNFERSLLYSPLLDERCAYSMPAMNIHLIHATPRHRSSTRVSRSKRRTSYTASRKVTKRKASLEPWVEFFVKFRPPWSDPSSSHRKRQPTCSTECGTRSRRKPG